MVDRKIPQTLPEFSLIMSEDFPHIPATWDPYLWDQWSAGANRDSAEFDSYMSALSTIDSARDVAGLTDLDD